MNEYIENVIKTVEKRDNAKPEYIQCVNRKCFVHSKK